MLRLAKRFRAYCHLALSRSAAPRPRPRVNLPGPLQGGARGARSQKQGTGLSSSQNPARGVAAGPLPEPLPETRFETLPFSDAWNVCMSSAASRGSASLLLDDTRSARRCFNRFAASYGARFEPHSLARMALFPARSPGCTEHLPLQGAPQVGLATRLALWHRGVSR